jgi:Icc-related predicted phosphoesterase
LTRRAAGSTVQQMVAKALVVSDVVSEVLYTPEVRTIASGVELILSCGDLPAAYLEYIVTMLDLPLFYVPGNHDRPTYRADGRLVEGPEGGRPLDGRVEVFRGADGQDVVLAGLGGSMFYGGTTNQYTERQMWGRMLRMAPALWRVRLRRGRAVDVFVTHAAPFGIHDGADPSHHGFRSFLSFMRRYRPGLMVHGHVHPSYGYDTKPRCYGATLVRSVYGYALMEVGS